MMRTLFVHAKMHPKHSLCEIAIQGYWVLDQIQRILISYKLLFTVYFAWHIKKIGSYISLTLD
jgi:hypothetical protein